MKKLRMFLLAAMVIGVASAFTTTSKMSMSVAYGNDGTWHEVDPVNIGVTFDCNAGTNYCLYQDASFSNPLPNQSQDKIFVLY